VPRAGLRHRCRPRAAAGAGTGGADAINGYIHSNDIQKDLDVLEIDDVRTDSARSVRTPLLDVQNRPHYRVRWRTDRRASLAAT
jgi:hypothetical protein